MKYILIFIAFVLISGTVIYQGVRHDATLTGDGITGNELKVDTTKISTQYDISGFVRSTGTANQSIDGNKTFTGGLIIPVSGGYAPTADGDIGYNSTQDKYVGGGAGGLSGSFPRILAVGHPAQTYTNSTIAEQDYTSIMTIPSNYLIENKALRITINYELVSGTSTVTFTHYLEIGGTKVYQTGALDIANGVTRSGSTVFVLVGTAAASGSSATETSGVVNMGYTGPNMLSVIDQPVNLATNGTLVITPGVVYSGTGSTETMTLRTYVIEEIN